MNLASNVARYLLGASMVFGVCASFVVIARGMLQPENHRSSNLAALVDMVESRDFSYVLLALVLLGRLDLFLWFGAFGIHTFWIAALVLQMLGSRQQPSPVAR